MIKSSVELLFNPILSELKLSHQRFSDLFVSDVYIIDKAVKYLQQQSSKKLRPAFLLLSAKMCGELNDFSVINAVIVEALHTATLIHDDVVDNSSTRRGVASLKEIYGNKGAVLLGDYIFSKCILMLLEYKNFEALELFANYVNQLCLGELKQFEELDYRNMDESEYLKRIEQKTSSLFSVACGLGAIAVNGNEIMKKDLIEFGRNFGIAFQIKDDILDYMGNEVEIGKPIGLDISFNNITAPLIYGYKNASNDMKMQIDGILNKKINKDNFLKLREIIEKIGGFSYAEKKIVEYSMKCESIMNNFPSSPAKQSLIDLVKFNQNRSS